MLERELEIIAQEWWKSSDYGRDQVQAEIDKYEEKFNGSS